MTSPYDSKLIMKPCDFDKVITKLRNFFKSKGFVEVHTQNRLSILAACEDPFNIRTFELQSGKWPLPQTGQMWLEYEMLIDPSVPGYFCVTTSYRDEDKEKMIEGRHYEIFPLFEFEMKGDMEALINLEMELLVDLGYDSSKFIRGKYMDVAKKYGVEELENEHEMMMYKEGEEKTPSFFLTDFPEHTSPFWNMRRYSDNGKVIAKKVDVIMSGHETIGSAEREVDVDTMYNTFMTISEGKYKDRIFELFGTDRPLNELKDFLKLNFFVRSGGGIGVHRLVKSLKEENLFN